MVLTSRVRGDFPRAGGFLSVVLRHLQECAPATPEGPGLAPRAPDQELLPPLSVGRFLQLRRGFPVSHHEELKHTEDDFFY